MQRLYMRVCASEYRELPMSHKSNTVPDAVSKHNNADMNCPLDQRDYMDEIIDVIKVGNYTIY